MCTDVKEGNILYTVLKYHMGIIQRRQENFNEHFNLLVHLDDVVMITIRTILQYLANADEA